MIGTTVGKYSITDRLGRGGMGIVYKALDETLDREVAIKVLNPDINDAELLKRFRAEAISLARLNHPGIATIYELHRHGDDLLMVMEYVRGETLQTLSERLGPLEPPQAAHICIQILDALAHAHRAGIVHRDLKPANVMVTDSGIVKIMDFGIARMLGGEHFTHAGYMMGTPAYMAPEQVLGQEIDGRADLYSVGVLFYRLLARELPFQADTAIAMAQKQVAEAPTPLGLFRPNLPPWCESIISRALSKAPADRFQSAEAFRAAILAAVTPAGLGELPTMATPTPASLLRTSDLTVPLAHASHAAGMTATRAITDVGVSTPRAAVTGGTADPTTPGSGVIPATERTGTTVVLGRGHLIALAAMVVVLIGGIAALGLVALKNGSMPFQTTAAPDTTAAGPASSGSEGAPEPQPTAVQTAQVLPPTGTPEKPVHASSPPVPPGGPSNDAASTSGTAGVSEEGTRKPKPVAKASDRAPLSVPLAPTSTEPEAPPITFDDVKVVVTQGDSMRDRDAVLRLAADHLLVLEQSGEKEILSLPYGSIVQAFYSRSKQPRWKGPDGKAEEANVELGKLSLFRGERNWLTLTTQASPVFLRFENADLQAALSAVQERTRVTVQRLAPER